MKLFDHIQKFTTILQMFTTIASHSEVNITSYSNIETLSAHCLIFLMDVFYVVSEFGAVFVLDQD